MKTLKFLPKLSVALALTMAIFYSDPALAAKRAPFQNTSSLQPMPSASVRPNISGNVNSAGKISPVVGQELNSPAAADQSGRKVSLPAVESVNNFPFALILLSVGILFAAFVCVIFYLSRKK